MNTSPSNSALKRSTTLWRRFQVWRGINALAKAEHHAWLAHFFREKAKRLIGKNAQAPSPLFDRLNEEDK